MNKNERSIWQNLGIALLYVPAVSFVGLIIITLVGAIDDAIQLANHGWLVLVVAYILSLIYLLYEPVIRKNREKEKAVDALVVYWRAQLDKHRKPDPTEQRIKIMRHELSSKFDMWLQSDPDLWNSCFGFDDKYPKDLFGIVDHYFEHQ